MRQGSAQELPLRRFGAVTVHDPDLARVYCERAFPVVSGFSFLGTGGSRLVSADTGIADIRISSVQTSGHVISVGDDRWVTLLVPLRGHLAVRIGGDSIRATRSGMLLVAVGERTTRVSRDYVGAIVRIPAERLAQQLDRLRQGGRQIAITDVGAECSGVDLSSLRSYVRYLIEDLDGLSLLHGQARAQVSAATLLVELAGNALWRAAARDELTGRVASASSLQMQRAEEVMRECYGDPITIADVADMVGVGARALQFAFRRHRGTTPRQALLDVRLDAARRRLVDVTDPASVTQIAFDCGIAHLGRFAAAYRKRYGELPSQTRKKPFR